MRFGSPPSTMAGAPGQVAAPLVDAPLEPLAHVEAIAVEVPAHQGHLLRRAATEDDGAAGATRPDDEEH
jgi:hypothetical protein